MIIGRPKILKGEKTDIRGGMTVLGEITLTVSAMLCSLGIIGQQ